MKKVAFILCISILLGSCVSTKKFKSELAKNSDLTNQLNTTQKLYTDCKNEKSAQEAKLNSLNETVDMLRKQNEFLKNNSDLAVKQLQDLSVISAKQAESISKSLDNIGAKDQYISQLQNSIARKDSLNMALVMNLKGAIGNLNDEDIQVKVDKGVVYVDISDKLLFKSGSWDISPRANEILGKVAKVLQNQPDIEFMVEGHTDNVAYNNGVLQDNWDLSVKRATAVVRELQNKYGIDPKKMTAAGRGEYLPLTDNSTPDNRSKNRRTRIVILPQLDQFFKLLETK